MKWSKGYRTIVKNGELEPEEVEEVDFELAKVQEKLKDTHVASMACNRDLLTALVFW